MIDVTTQETVLARGPQTELELYELMLDHIGNTMRIRRKAVERAGVLIRLSYDREWAQTFFSFGKDEMLDVNIRHRVEVRLDGVWKVLCKGDQPNWELSR